VELVDAIAPTGRRSGFTFAPEAGSQRMRDTINKGVGDEEILRCAELAFDNGWSSIKLYFMIGLPGETIEDVLAIGDISRRILEMGRQRHGGKAQVKCAVSTFVPKVGTPFQWDGQDATDEIETKVGALRRTMHGKGLTMAWHDPGSSMLEAALGRGDRRLGAVIERAWRKGARLDAWDIHFRFDLWREAFAEEGLDPAWYACRDIPTGEPLPWAHLGAGASEAFLLRDRKRAIASKTTPDCHWGPCANCGVPAATGFACDTGEQGPRRLLVRVGDGAAEAGAAAGGRPGTAHRVRPVERFAYVGPPGDPRRGDVAALPDTEIEPRSGRPAASPATGSSRSTGGRRAGNGKRGGRS
jgi:hypothetical protein